MKIIKIQFSSPKIYSYLLDAKSPVSPKAGDVLKQFTGCSLTKAYYTSLNVIEIVEVATLPSFVTAMISVKNKELECNVCTLSEAALVGLRTPCRKISTPKPKIVTSTVSSETFVKSVRDVGTQQLREILNKAFLKGGK